MTDFNSFGAEYRGATFVGVERQSLHQVKGRSPAQFIVVDDNKYWVLLAANARVYRLRHRKKTKSVERREKTMKASRHNGRVESMESMM